MKMEMRLPDRPKSRPEIWRLAMFLHARFGKATDWPVADKAGWYRAAHQIHDEVYRQTSPNLAHDIPPEAWAFEFPIPGERE